MLDRIALSLTMPLLLAAGVPENWKAFESKPGRFAVAFPATPKETTQTVATATSKLQVTLFVAEGRNDASFVVSFLDYSQKDLKTGSIDKRLDLARDGAVSSTGGKLKSETPIELAGHKGRDLVIEKDGTAIARMRIYFVERRLYQVMVLGNARDKDVVSFFDSFRLNK
jgi:hypothetical protein